MIDYIATLRMLKDKADNESSRLGALAKEYGRLLAIEAGGTVEGLTLTTSQKTRLGARKANIEAQVILEAAADVLHVVEKPPVVEPEVSP